MTRIPRTFPISVPRLGSALSVLRDREIVTAAGVGAMFGRSVDTGYRILRGDWDDFAGDFNHALHERHPAPARDAVHYLLTAGTPYAPDAAPSSAGASLDFNGDNKVDTRDGVDGVVGGAAKAMGLIKKFRAAEHGRSYSEQQGAELTADLSDAIRHLERVRMPVGQLTTSRR